MLVHVVRFASKLTYDELLAKARERAPKFRALPGLVQKYYTRTPEHDRFAGIYLWENEEAMRQFKDSALAASIPEAYQVIGTVEQQLYEVAFPLRGESAG